MALLQLYSCATCGLSTKTFKATPEHCGHPMVRQLAVPQSKFLEAQDLERGKSAIKDKDQMLTARAKAYVRDQKLEDMVDSNRRETAQALGWLNEKGTVRKKIDEL